jgi:hypothetical protein
MLKEIRILERGRRDMERIRRTQHSQRPTSDLPGKTFKVEGVITHGSSPENPLVFNITAAFWKNQH